MPVEELRGHGGDFFVHVRAVNVGRVVVRGLSFLASSRASIEKRVVGYTVGQDDEPRVGDVAGGNIPRYREGAAIGSAALATICTGIEIFSNASGEAAAGAGRNPEKKKTTQQPETAR